MCIGVTRTCKVPNAFCVNSVCEGLFWFVVRSDMRCARIFVFVRCAVWDREATLEVNELSVTRWVRDQVNARYL